MLAITKLHPALGARVTGLDLNAPLDDATFASVREAFERHSVLVFPGQAIDDAAQIRFSERFGPLEATRAGANGAGSQLIVLTNIGEDGSIVPPTDKQMLNNRANQLWHSDSSFKPEPARASLLSAREIPSEGGDTEFASVRAAYAALPEAEKRALEGLVAIHDFAWSRSRVDPALMSPAERAAHPPVRQAVVLESPKRQSALSWRARGADRGHGVTTAARALDRSADGIRDAGPVRLPPPLGAARSGALGQPGGAASRDAVQVRQRAPAYGADDGCGRRRPSPGGRTRRRVDDVEGRFDYVIVGAGSAGCVLANRLTEDPATRVLLLEAGGSDRHPYIQAPAGFIKTFQNPRFNWCYTTEPVPGAAGRTHLLSAREGARRIERDQRLPLRPRPGAGLRCLGAVGLSGLVLRRRAAVFPQAGGPLRRCRPASAVSGDRSTSPTSAERHPICARRSSRRRTASASR